MFPLLSPTSGGIFYEADHTCAYWVNPEIDLRPGSLAPAMLTLSFDFLELLDALQ
ncbi:hypothetical protein [Candidatus Cyanaurora vandensis]|uniref:hypothetical protein n=1 Tax=Candidatus Cyanaurora vandensis TaxID=2714958 RepID=UPI00257A65C8|nr:hypothetical protein [Candidatus Cyanaurora vandensis]